MSDPEIASSTLPSGDEPLALPDAALQSQAHPRRAIGKPVEVPPMQGAVEGAQTDAAGTLHLHGWAVSKTAIEQVAVFINNRLMGLAQHSLARVAVGRDYRHYPNAHQSGFSFSRKLDGSDLRGQTVRVAILAAGGNALEMSAPIEPGAELPAATGDAGTLQFYCDEIRLSEDGKLLVDGWALCRSGIRSVIVSVDTISVGPAETGRLRPDVASRFPSMPGAATAGFRFVGGLGRRYVGDHMVRITISALEGTTASTDYPVRAVAEPAADPSSDHSVKLFLDLPVVAAGAAVGSVAGSLSLAGWALSIHGIAGIEVQVDGVALGEAHYGIRREDVHASFPELPGALLSGFGMLIPPQTMKNGARRVRIVARDLLGGTAEIQFSVVVAWEPENNGPASLRRKLPPSEIDFDLAILHAVECHPRFEILLALDEQRAGRVEARLARTLASLRDQVYADWRLTIASPVPLSCRELGPEFESIAARVSLARDPSSIDVVDAPGRPLLICALRAGDELGEDALIELALARAEQPDGDFFYSDDRRHDPADNTIKAFFKPDWSPDLLLSTNYVGRIWAVATAVMARAGMTTGDLLRRGAYDLVLRLTEHARRIVHIPKVLCAGALPENRSRERRALVAAVKRRGINAQVLDGCLPATYRIKRALTSHPPVSIIIPTMAARGLVKDAISSIREKTLYPNYAIICLDNIPDHDVSSKRYIEDNADVVVEVHEPFNWSRINNIGASKARGDLLLFLNDDIEVCEGDWLNTLVEQAERPEVGVVGPRLLYPDGRVQHAGMFLSRSVARHAFRFAPAQEPGPFGLALIQRNVLAVTGACMLVRRTVFEELGGFDESHAIINNDLDLCLRAHSHNLLVVYVPQATLIHHEMASRFSIKDSYDSERFSAEWQNLFLSGDPYFSPHLNLDLDDYVPQAEPLRVLHAGHPLIDKRRIRRILAVKLDHIGDFVTALPAMRRLKQHFPQAELWVLAATASLSLAHLEPAIDRTIEFNFFHRVSGQGARAVPKSELDRMRRTLRALHFDLAIDLRMHPETRPVLQLAGARWNAGFDYRGTAARLDISIEWEGDNARRQKRVHVVDSLLRLVDAVGAACANDRTDIISSRCEAEAGTELDEYREIAPIAAQLFARPIVCMHVGGGAENKRWPLASFKELIDLVISHDQVNVLLVGSIDEVPLVDELFASVRRTDRLFSLVGKVGLGDLPLLLRSCVLFVGNDSGPKHLASSLGVPTIGIHSGTVDAAEWGPRGPAAVAVSRDMTCSPCYLLRVEDCPRGLACLTGIAVGDVYRLCRRMLSLRLPIASHSRHELRSCVSEG